LERSIKEFEGTVLVVTHDRYFLNQVADRLIVLGGGRARVIEGDYETYQNLVQKEKENAERAASRQAAAPAASKAADRSGGGARKKFPYRKAADLEREIGELESELVEVEDLLGQPATWRDPIKAVRTQERHGEIKSRLEALYLHWEFAVESQW